MSVVPSDSLNAHQDNTIFHFCLLAQNIQKGSER